MKTRVLLVGGATGTGKSALAIALAKAFGGEIVNADSQQVYRGLDIGTAKPTLAERAEVPHHLFDIAEPHEQLDAAHYLAAADRVIAEIASRKHVPVVVGGTGLWLRALVRGLADAPPRDEAVRARLERERADHGLGPLHARLVKIDPDAAKRIHPNDPIRIIRALEVFELTGRPLSAAHAEHRTAATRYDAFHLAIDWRGPAYEAALLERVRAMFRGGLVEEARVAARDERVAAKLPRVIGYREALQLMRGEITENAAIQGVFIAQRQYAKRQRTWFNGEPEWRWFDAPVVGREPFDACETFLGPRDLSGSDAAG